MISVKIISLPSAIERLRARGPQIVEALTAKMDELMIRLREKVVGGTIPQFFPNGAPNIAGTVEYHAATRQGNKISGYVTAGAESLATKTVKRTLKSGAEVDYAAVQEVGVAHSWEILPFNKKALAFMLDGKKAIYRRVVHPPLEARPFMRTALEEMTPEIISGLESSVEGLLNG